MNEIVLTMTKDDIMNLPHTTFTEDELFIYVTPDEGYYLIISDYPTPIYEFGTVQMLKQEMYSDIIVKPIYDPSTGLNSIIYENIAFNASTGDDDYSWRTN